MSKNIHALLIGINNYAPESNVRRLGGCVKDVEKMKEHLENNFQNHDLKIKLLVDEQATRKSIIDSFLSHLCHDDINAGDSILFYYSGHGSYSKTAAVFNKYDPMHNDETLVCYDSRLPGHYDLTDKEIAVLLSKIKKGVQIMVVVDACHSGSITRDIFEIEDELTARYTPARQDEAARDLSTYFLPKMDNYYLQLIKENKEVVIPESAHIVFSACSREQKAMERFGRGVFSYHFLEVLKKSNNNLSYAQLFERVQSAVLMDNPKQTPALFVAGDFDHRKVFLMDSIIDFLPPYHVAFRNGHWCLDHGAIYGMNTNADAIKKLRIGIYQKSENATTYDLLENVKVKAVKINETILDFDFTDKEATFQGSILNTAISSLIYLKGTEKELDDFLNKIKDIKPASIGFTTNQSHSVQYELDINTDKIHIRNRANNSAIQSYNKTRDGAFAELVKTLVQLDKYDAILKLENPSTELDHSNVEFRFFLETAQGELLPYTNNEIQLDFNNEKILFQIKAKNNTDLDLYISLLHLSPQFGIEVYYGCTKFPKAQNDKKDFWTTLDKQHVLTINNPLETSSIDRFKLIVSTDPFNDYKYEEKNLRSTELRKEAKPKAPEKDWFTKMISSRLVRSKGVLNQNDISINSLTFKGHPSFKANVQLTSLHTNTRSIHPAQSMKGHFKKAGFEILNLASASRGVKDLTEESIIELNLIEQEASLANKALDLEIDIPLKSNEYIIPYTLTDGLLIPIGNAFTKRDEKTIISITHLPSSDDYTRDIQTRSPTRAVWFALVKFIMPSEDVYQLRYIWKYEKNKPIYGNLPPALIKGEVKKANKVLLLIHGIIGNTKAMATAVENLLAEDKYAVILTYDYENLNSEIETIAEQLDAKLNEIGLDKDSDKKIDVIAHSMGGLVIRHLIERIRKDHVLVDKLLLFGTPNGGSVFSNLTKVRDTALFMFTIASNLSEYLAFPIAPWLYTVNGILAGTSPLSTTLLQMHPDSTFIKSLSMNRQQSKTDYHIIAGNIQRYEPAGNLLSRLSEKVKIAGLQVAYKNTPSDLIVSVEQTTQLPESFRFTSYEVGAYHMNYFDLGGKAQGLIYEILGDIKK